MQVRLLLCTLPLTLLLLGGAVLLLAEPPDADASPGWDATTKKLVATIRSDAALNLRLLALEKLRRHSGEGVDAALVSLAKGSETKLAVFATTFLGKRKSEAAKTALKGIVTTGSVDDDVRESALTAIAVHFRDASDLTWMEQVTKTDTALSAHVLFLKSRIYQR